MIEGAFAPVGGEVAVRTDVSSDSRNSLLWCRCGRHTALKAQALIKILIVFPGRMLLTDVAVSHSLTPSQIATGGSASVSRQTKKNIKYAGVASRLGAELLNVSIDSCGGMASSASALVRAIGEEGERWSAGTWTSGAIERQLLGAIAMAVQRGNALAMLSGYTRSAIIRARPDGGETDEGGAEGEESEAV